MKKITTTSLMFLAAICLTLSVAAGAALAAGYELCYQVTVTNMTRGQVLTPVLIATHKRGVKLFTPGEAASVELEYLAEGGDTAPLANLLGANPRVGTVAVAGTGPFHPGESVTAQVPASFKYNRLSLASMLAITNDGIIALNDVLARKGMHVSPVYDAGTEANDELEENIPAFLNGEGFNPDRDGEDFVHIHAGIHGVGDLPAEELDWRNPAARITSKLVRCNVE